jgi:hypothetical protein
MTNHKTATSGQRWVVKIGSALLTNDGKGLDMQAIAGWVDQLAELRQQGVEIVLVSSGAIAEGRCVWVGLKGLKKSICCKRLPLWVRWVWCSVMKKTSRAIKCILRKSFLLMMI